MDQAWFLNAEQKQQANVRYEFNKVNYNEDEKFDWAEVRKALTAWPVGSSPRNLYKAEGLGVRCWRRSILRRYHFIRNLDFHVRLSWSARDSTDQ